MGLEGFKNVSSMHDIKVSSSQNPFADISVSRPLWVNKHNSRCGSRKRADKVLQHLRKYYWNIVGNDIKRSFFIRRNFEWQGYLQLLRNQIVAAILAPSPNPNKPHRPAGAPPHLDALTKRINWMAPHH